MERLSSLRNQIVESNPTAAKKIYFPPRPKKKLDWFKKNGWGYTDTEFRLGPDGIVRLSGNRYDVAGVKLPHFRVWAEEKLGLDINNVTPAQDSIPVEPPVRNENFLADIKGKCDEITEDDEDRVFHSHGHSLQELFMVRHSKLPRSVDLVVYVNSHAQVELVVKAAVQHNVVVIPFGGGTNVTQALMCPANEARTIVSLDMSRLNHVKWVDKKSMSACIEAGIYGQDLERELAKYGLVLGHEPDSVEFSSLGGWIATRASGMKKNKYGNIDDILINVKVVTPVGTFNKLQNCPRVSSGPDINEFILGSEGTLGVITEAIVKVRPTPKKQCFDSIIFHDFEIGIQFMYDVGMSKVWPASIRLVDNTQFQFGLALKPEQTNQFQIFVDSAKKYFVTQVKQFEPSKMAVVTIVYEGSEFEVNNQMAMINQLTKKFKGLRAGEENGKRGYFLTFAIAYLRDFAFRYSFIAESFETSVPWNNVSVLCKNVTQRILDECKQNGVKGEPFVSFRVTQVYDTGAAVYIYFGFLYGNLKDPVTVYEHVEDAAREEIMKNGGSISHHHGVGKLRKKFLENSVGTTGVKILKGLKTMVDPNNIFGNGNLL